MSSHLAVATVIGLVFVWASFARAENVESSTTNSPKLRVCGSRLVQMVSKVCSMQRRLCLRGRGERLVLVDESSEEDNKLRLRRHQETAKGIAEDCCTKGCSMAYLHRYCCSLEEAELNADLTKATKLTHPAEEN